MGRLEVPWDLKTSIGPSLARTKTKIVYTADPKIEFISATNGQEISLDPSLAEIDFILWSEV